MIAEMAVILAAKCHLKRYAMVANLRGDIELRCKDMIWMQDGVCNHIISCRQTPPVNLIEFTMTCGVLFSPPQANCLKSKAC
ncbi:hypothetical protein THIOM_001403 [Candidatus Thiomargarita nelsonii]|uniref:Uncharacterized protein n=1 Tax=Candidatus Thiomargarita nelsonii TaxID=1003181 RepID=A0A176S3U6_9GAMM|nr:hypothetical protein THIOM_001403 [Candidatus Thiomargarita nelsonii]